MVSIVIVEKFSRTQREISKNIVLELRTFILKNRVNIFGINVLNIRIK